VEEEAPCACDGSTTVGAAVCVVGADVDVVVTEFPTSVLVTILPVNMVSGPMMIGTTSCTVCPSPSVDVCVNVLVAVSCSSFPPRVVVVVVECSTFRVDVGAAVDVAVTHSYALSMMDSGISFPEPVQYI
jgi:hypothetical protein